VNYENKELVFENIPAGKVCWQSPSNIALVKYWGKIRRQIPANPSVSYTLSESLTETIVEFSPVKEDIFNVEFLFEDKVNDAFAAKTTTFFDGIFEIFPFIKQLDFRISSKNTFPHSAGIASSASGMSAIALCLCEIERKYFDSFQSEEEFLQKASYVARLGSGSACRSVYGGLVSWGEIERKEGTSNLFGSKLKDNVHPVFKNFHDSILIVDSGQKKVSSTVGHGLMKTNPFADGRFKQANRNIHSLLGFLKSGDLDGFVEVVESEALTLHSMMMTSNPYFLLMKPNTISIIEKIWEFRKETGIQACFTLDAGPNIHLLYPSENKKEVRLFIESELLQFTLENTVIQDKVGNGPVKLFNC